MRQTKTRSETFSRSRSLTGEQSKPSVSSSAEGLTIVLTCDTRSRESHGKQEKGENFLKLLDYAHKRRIIIYGWGEKVMKTKELIKLLEKNGWKFKRHGANHDIYVKDGKRESIVRHRETDEDLARAIIRRNGLE